MVRIVLTSNCFFSHTTVTANSSVQFIMIDITKIMSVTLTVLVLGTATPTVTDNGDDDFSGDLSGDDIDLSKFDDIGG